MIFIKRCKICGKRFFRHLNVGHVKRHYPEYQADLMTLEEIRKDYYALPKYKKMYKK